MNLIEYHQKSLHQDCTNFSLFRVHLKCQKHVRCETRGFYDVQIVLQNTLNEADGVLLAKPNSRKQ
jgi:hypothetical protein